MVATLYTTNLKYIVGMLNGKLVTLGVTLATSLHSYTSTLPVAHGVYAEWKVGDTCYNLTAIATEVVEREHVIGC